MRYNTLHSLLIIALVVAVLGTARALCCTSAIVSAKATLHGRPLLWKNRDTGTTDNFIARRMPTTEDELTFVALYNAGDSLLEEAWMGMNEAGFAIMNTASYNLAPDTAKYADQEGRLMTAALARCRTLIDFERLLDTLPKPLGVQANFGVIDATGDGAYYETDDYNYLKYPLADSDNGVLIRTNYSFSGDSIHGMGYIRYANAEQLLATPTDSCAIEPSIFTDGLSRSFYHSLLGRDVSCDSVEWIIDQDFIPRRSTSASIVIEGIVPGEEICDMVMWTAMGYPPVARTQAVTLDSIPSNLLPDSRWHSTESDAAARRRAEVFSIPVGSGQHYINLPRLRHYLNRVNQ